VKGWKESVTSTVQGTRKFLPTISSVLSKLANELYAWLEKDCWLIFWYGPTWHTEVKRELSIAAARG